MPCRRIAGDCQFVTPEEAMQIIEGIHRFLGSYGFGYTQWTGRLIKALKEGELRIESVKDRGVGQDPDHSASEGTSGADKDS